jgi:hypothetical protein
MNRSVSLLVCVVLCFAVSATHALLSTLFTLSGDQSGAVFAQQQAQQQAPQKQRRPPKYDIRKDADRKKLFNMSTDTNSENSTFAKIIVEGKERDPTECFKFRIKYDSAGVSYYVDNLRLNRKPVLSENSEIRQTMRTQPCRVQGGDTLQFYRSVSWENVELFKRSAWPTREASAKMSALDRQDLQMRYAFQSATCYQAYHELAWSVELVSSTTGKRLLLIDSIKFDAQPSPGSPSIQLQAPPTAQIRYVVPASLPQQQAFVRIVPYARAVPSSHIPTFKTRQDVIFASDFYKDFEASPDRQMLVQKIMAKTTQTVNVMDLAEINRAELQAASDRGSTSLVVAPNPSSGDVTITINTPVNASTQNSPERKYTLVVYNASGQAQWTWLNAEPSQAFTFRATAIGVFYLVAYDADSNTALRSQSFIIKR